MQAVYLNYLTLSFEMSIQRKQGQWGEDQAVSYILNQGLILLERNWRYKRAEIDIIAKEGEILVFIEVKTRSYTDFGSPEEKVGKQKQRFLIDAGMAYMRSIGHDWEIRFDIVSVLGKPGDKIDVRHFRDAFFPGLGYK